MRVGMWIWEVNRCEGGSVERIVQKCTDIGLGHVLIKTNDGVGSFNGTLGPLVRALHDAGVNVWAWAYTYGRQPEAEARAFAERSEALNVNGMCVDAEVEYKNHASAAVRYMDSLRSLTQRTIGVSSYYLPQNHPTFPWQEFYSRADFALPQIYWYSNNPVLAAQRSYQQHSRYFTADKIIPAGAAYPEATGKPENIRKFLDEVERLGAGQVNFWSWQHATPQMWEVIRLYTHK